MKQIVIFDIDGTLANAEHRVHHLQKEPKDWDAFFAGCTQDTPIEPVMELVRLFFVTGFLHGPFRRAPRRNGGLAFRACVHS